jgi:hypothetical protein
MEDRAAAASAAPPRAAAAQKKKKKNGGILRSMIVHEPTPDHAASHRHHAAGRYRLRSAALFCALYICIILRLQEKRVKAKTSVMKNYVQGLTI